MKIKITNDLYDICWRSKEIDSTYEIFYNTEKHRYEVYSNGRLEIVSPYKELDARLLTKLRQTRIERIEKILKELDENNLKIETAKKKEMEDRADYKAKSLLNYHKHHDSVVGYEEL